MSKVTTTYDNTLKEKVFIIKGEEGYARSTDCILTELYTNDGERRADWNTSLDAMKLEFRIDVLRDVGASQVVLYDNDTTIGVYDFDTNTHSIDLKYESDEEDNRVILSYGVEHHIYAKYMGNKQCMKSQSQSYIVDEPIPDAFNCELVFTDEYGEDLTTFDYDTAPEIHLGIKLVAESYISGNTIQIFDNDELIVETTTDSEGAIAFALHKSPLIDTGLHRLKAKFNGTQYLESKSATVDISVGYQVTVEEYPQYRVNGEPINIVAKVQSYLGNPPLTWMSTGYYVVKGATDSPVARPDENGYLYFNDVLLNGQTFRVGLEILQPPEYIDYVSEVQTILIANNVTLSLSTDKSIIVPNTSTDLTASLEWGTQSGLLTGIPIQFNEDTVLSNQGIASYTLNGSGAGDITVTASIYNSSDSVDILDVYQYWSKRNGSMGQYYLDRYGKTTSLSSGWRCTPSSNLRYSSQLMIIPDNAISMQFQVKMISNLTGIGYYNSPITGVKSGDIIEVRYNVDSQYVSYLLNGSVVATTQYYGNAIGLDFYFADTNGYITIDELKVKRYTE